MVKFIKEEFAYLIIQPLKKVESESSSVLGGFETQVATATIGFLPLYIPIPLKQTVPLTDINTSFTGFQQTGFTKSTQLISSTASGVINASAFAGTSTLFEQEFSTQNNSKTFTTKGTNLVNIDIICSIKNIFELAFEGYIELAGTSAQNCRFHYISNDTLAFNMLLQDVIKSKEGLNSVYSMVFVRPETGLTKKTTKQAELVSSTGLA